MIRRVTAAHPHVLRWLARGAVLAVALIAGLASLQAHPTDEDAEPAPAPPGPLTIADTQMEPVAWSDIAGWAADDLAAGFAAFLPSCRSLVSTVKSARDARPMHAALVEVCRRALAAVPLDEEGARKFFEENFRPVRISKLDDAAGFLTGYYEPVVEGSRWPTRDFTTPLYRRPLDLVHMGRKHKADGFPNKGRVARRLPKRKYVPYYDRGEIEDGALDGRQLEICWLKDPIEAFFIAIQGSARVRLEDGVVLRINYDAHNGYPYTPVGRILIDRKIVPKEEMSMDRIRQWMTANPDEAKELRRNNRSYVFFRITGLSEQEEAIGAQGVPLTAVRSIATDKSIHVYGTPFFIDADLPIADDTPSTKFRRLMISQDTGSAIIGPARADIYFGAGDDAGRVSGRIKNQGRFVMLIPRELDPVAAGAQMPVPTRDPRLPDAVPVAMPEVAARVSALKPEDVPVPRPRPVVATRATKAKAVPPPPRGKPKP